MDTNDEPPINPKMLKMNEAESFDPDYWLSLAAHDYIATRILVLAGIDRLGAYHLQQAVEKYIKAFILKEYGIEKRIKGKKEYYIINGYKDNDGKEVKFETHDLNKLLECCQKKEKFFQKDRVKTFINMLSNFNEIRYPSSLSIDYTTEKPTDESGFVSYLDYFAKYLRDLVNSNFKADLIWELQSLPLLNLDEYGFIYGERLEDIGKFFFHENNSFKPTINRD